jgi:hypothetical protein
VRTKLSLKADGDDAKPYDYAQGQINATRLLKYVLECKNIADEDKSKLCRPLRSSEAKKWIEDYNKELGAQISKAPAAEALVEAQAAAKSEAEKAEAARGRTLTDFGIQSCTAAQAKALMFYIARFFLVCTVPFLVIEHWAFCSMISAFAPSFARAMTKRKSLSDTWLPKLYDDTQEKVAAMLSTKRKKTAIIDGFKDRRKRHVMNISWGVRGFVSYLKTAWFGRRRHTGEVYGEELISTLGDDVYNTIAVVADNTGSMSSMQKGLFGHISRKYPTIFLIGCGVHVYDLLAEDVAQLEHIAPIVAEAKFIVTFVLRYSLIFETFIHLQARRKKNDVNASMLGLKLFPDTRFAYAVLMIVTVLLNWSVLVEVLDSDEFKLSKRHSKVKQRPDFIKFEDLVGSVALKRKLEAVRASIGPVCVALHYNEGDSVPISHIVPVYAVLYASAQKPPATVTDVFKTDECKTVVEAMERRWIPSGSGSRRTVGLRHDVHCLAYELDWYTQLIVEVILGEEMATAVVHSYTDQSARNAIAQHCGGTTTAKYGRLMTQFRNFNARRGVYNMHDEIRAVVKLKAGALLKTMDDETKGDPTKCLIAILKEVDDIGGASIMFENLIRGGRLSADEREFCDFALDIGEIVGHACAVERLNKGHSNLHSKARASLKPTTVLRALYVYTNEQLLYKASLEHDLMLEKQHRQQRKATASELEALAHFTAEDAEENLASLANLDGGEYLPADRVEVEDEEEEYEDDDDLDLDGQDTRL